MQIIQNLLHVSDLENLKNVMINPNFPWFYHSSVDYDPSLLGLDAPYNFQFVHTFYSNHTPNSQHIEILSPIIEKLNPVAFVKIKANLLTRTETVVEHQMHVDVPGVKCKTAIFYVNSCNGYTKFSTDEKIYSQENKMIIFDSDLSHTGSTCTDDKCRIVINFNYF